MSASQKSPWVLHYDASSCNGCDIEVLAALTPRFDVERFGIINTGNPKHADVFLITGSVNERQVAVIRQLYSQMLEPKVVVACGICACTGGVFKECYNNLGGVDVAIPVDVYAPGCAVRPEAIIDAVVAGLGVLEQKRAELAAGVYEPAPLPPVPTAAQKYIDGESVASAWNRAVTAAIAVSGEPAAPAAAVAAAAVAAAAQSPAAAAAAAAVAAAAQSPAAAAAPENARPVEAAEAPATAAPTEAAAPARAQAE